ncbi:hypothetical protein D3C76_1600220 [compost metagenome]
MQEQVIDQRSADQNQDVVAHENAEKPWAALSISGTTAGNEKAPAQRPGLETYLMR